ncbi:MAG: hypothetical protein Q7R73_02200 [bacterium]|nr:hypothetical protein [bacterium]
MFQLKNKKVLVIISGFLLIVGVGYFILVNTGNLVDIFGLKEANIKREIAKANYCNVASDCRIIAAQCPFGCYAPVNKKEAGRIETMINGYESMCIYQCIKIKGVDCIDNKCQILE